ncbi:50S ribosomal protein L32 [bacterium]|nr:50S ribosomal protein L32 [bacterium]
MRSTHAHTGNRRSHHALDGARFAVCAKCKASHIRHRACEKCGTYRGKEVLSVAVKSATKVEKK